MESASGSDVRWPRVGDVELGHMARQDFARGRSRWCGVAGAWHITARHNIYMALRHRGAHGDNCEVKCVLDVRKKPSFTHARDNLRGDVSEKRFNTHAMERNVADVAQERLSDGTGCTDTWHCHVGPFTGHCYRVPAQGTVTGYSHWKHCHESLQRISAAAQRHSGI